MQYLFLCLLVLCVKCCAGGECGVVTKKEWGGLGPIQVEYLPRPVSIVIIQHTATPTCSTDQDCKSRVRNIQDYHMDNLNFWDIGHSFLIGGTGKVYEGSGWLHVGAHTVGFNRRSIGISFIGNFNEEEPTAAALEAAKNLIKCGVEKGHLTKQYKLVGHRQVLATESPGRYLYNQIRRWDRWQDNVDNL